jgi:hypothetical protein
LTALPGGVLVSHGTEVDVVDIKKGEVTGKIVGADEEGGGVLMRTIQSRSARNRRAVVQNEGRIS